MCVVRTLKDVVAVGPNKLRGSMRCCLVVNTSGSGGMTLTLSACDARPFRRFFLLKGRWSIVTVRPFFLLSEG